MLAKTSKETSDRAKACRFLLAAFFHQGPEISRLLVETFRPHRQEGDPEPDFFATVVALGRKLKHSIGRVVAADNALFAAHAALDAAIQARDDETRALSRLVIGLRGACNALFVDLPVQQLGFDTRTFQDPVPLLIQADRVVGSLSCDPIEAERVFEDDDFEPQKYAVKVEEEARDLRAALDAVAEARRQADTALLDKRAATREYDTLFLHGARTFESYCRMAGRTELADRVRPSESRPGRTRVAPDEVPDPGDEAPESTVEARSPEPDGEESPASGDGSAAEGEEPAV